MKTNYSKTEFLVLTNQDSKVMAIIKVQKGADITEQIHTAICEDYDCNAVKILNALDLTKYAYNIDFNVEIIREDEESIFEIFELTLTTIY